MDRIQVGLFYTFRRLTAGFLNKNFAFFKLCFCRHSHGRACPLVLEACLVVHKLWAEADPHTAAIAQHLTFFVHGPGHSLGKQEFRVGSFGARPH